MHRVVSSELVPLESTQAQTCWTSAKEESIRFLGQTMSSSLKTLKEAAQGGSEAEMKRGIHAVVFRFYCRNASTSHRRSICVQRRTELI